VSNTQEASAQVLAPGAGAAIFVPNKYRHWHDLIIDRARTRGKIDYSERHHIVPRSLGGRDNEENLVFLTYREHFLIHWILTKLTVGSDRRKMLFALVQMGRRGTRTKRKTIGWQFELMKRANAEASKGRKKSPEERLKISIRNIGNQHAKGHQNAKGMKHTEKFKKEMSERLKNKPSGFKGWKHTEEVRLLLSMQRKGKKQWWHGPLSEKTKEAMRYRANNPTPKMLERRRKHSLFMMGNQYARIHFEA
jgi:hypothetical protein